MRRVRVGIVLQCLKFLCFVQIEYFQVMDKGVHPKRREKIHRVIDSLLQQTASAWGTEMYSEDSEEDEDTEDNEVRIQI